MTKTSIAIILLLCAVVLLFPGFAGTQAAALQKAAGPAVPAAAAGDMPTKDEVEAAMKRTFGYDPSITWVIYDIRPSPIPGVADVLVSMNKGQPQDIFVSAATQTAIAGQLIPFGPNPFAPARATLQAADGPAQGSKTPAILLVEFSDLECPHCKAAQPIAEKLVADFPQVRYIFQQFPLPASMHPWAMIAAKYADCVGRLSPDSFFKYIDTVFDNQGSIAAPTAEDKLKEFATTLGLDAQKISTCANQPETEARVQKSVDLGRSLEVTQTPTLFVNGRRVLGLADSPYDQLKKIVQFEIDHAGK
jgi:protein-disulfide isomerase